MTLSQSDEIGALVLWVEAETAKIRMEDPSEAERVVNGIETELGLLLARAAVGRDEICQALNVTDLRAHLFDRLKFGLAA